MVENTRVYVESDDDNFPLRNAQTSANDQHVWNWAQNSRLGEQDAIRRPVNEHQLQSILADSRGNVKILGSRLTPGRMLRTDQPQDLLIETSYLRGLLTTTADTLTFAAGTSLHEVYQTLTAMGRMLPASPGVIDIQTLAGALATGTHGQGLKQSSLCDAVLNIRMMLAGGRILELDSDHQWFGAAQVALGTLGVMTAVTLKTTPLKIYTCFKNAYDASALETSLYDWNENFTFSKAWWFPDQDKVHVWVARESTEDELALYQENGREPVKHSKSNNSLNSTVNQTLRYMQRDTRIQEAQGKPYLTVTRFKDFSDEIGDIYQIFCRGIAAPQINIEIGIPFYRAVDVISRIKKWHAATHPHMHYPIILRCTGPSAGWLSPAYQEATCYFGFVVYYAEDGTLSGNNVHFLQEVEKLLAKEGGRPHWGKYFDRQLYNWREIYPKWQQFRAAKLALDPNGRFSNSFITDILR